MKEKYEYESVKEIGTLDGILLFGGIILLFFSTIKHSDLEPRTFWILASIAGSALICWLARLLVPMHFTADETAVTFRRFFRKKIVYSSIKSIDLRLEKRIYKKKEGNRTVRHTYFIEILTFHCENGDHSFACKSEPSQKTITCSNNSEIVSPDDTTYSPFSRLKVYIEDKIMKDSRSIPDTDPKKEQKKMKEKYQYSTVKDTTTPEALILFAGMGLMIYLCANHSDLERLTFWILTFICVSVLGCWIGRFIFPMRFAADDYAVTFSRIFRKKIPYSSIKSIDLRTEKRMYKTKSGNRTIRHMTTTEIITFHCENGDHSFACELDKSQKSLAWVNKSITVSPDDKMYSAFSRLKAYIEERNSSKEHLQGDEKNEISL